MTFSSESPKTKGYWILAQSFRFAILLKPYRFSPSETELNNNPESVLKS